MPQVAGCRSASFWSYVVRRNCGQHLDGLRHRSLRSVDVHLGLDFIQALGIQRETLPRLPTPELHFMHDGTIRGTLAATVRGSCVPAIGDGAANAIGSGCTLRTRSR